MAIPGQQVFYGDGTIPSAATVSALFDGDDSAEYNSFGYGVAVADFDGDGVDDLVVGAPGYNYSSSTRHQSGTLNVIYGDSTTNWTSGALPDLVAALTADQIDGEADLDRFGYQLSMWAT